MAFIMVFDSMTAVSRAGEAVQSAADRAARTAALCCLYTDDAEQTARDSVDWLESAASRLDIGCRNDLSQSALVHFEDADGTVVASGEQVPKGGTVRVRLECDVSGRTLGSFAMLPVVERSGVGTAAIDPYRYRTAPVAVLPGTGLHLECHSGAPNKLTLRWADPKDSSITGYKYRMRTSSSNWSPNWIAIAGGGTATSHLVDGLTQGTEYHFQLQTVFDDGSTAQGPQNAAGFVSGVPGTPPQGPVGYRAIGGDKKVTLKWDDPAEHPSSPDSTITGYRYKMRWAGYWRPGTSGADVADALSIPGGTTSYPAEDEYDRYAVKVGTLVNGRTYHFILFAENGCGTSGVIRPISGGNNFAEARPTS